MLPTKDGFEFKLFPPGEALAPYCHTLYAVSCKGDGIDDVVPSYSPQLVLFLSGAAEMRFATGQVDREGGVALVSQIEEAAHLTIEAPARMMGASLTILGWIALGAPPMEKSANRLQPAANQLGGRLVDRLEALRQGADADFDTIGDTVSRFSDILADCVQPPRKSTADFVTTVQSWLHGAFDPQLADLHEQIHSSPRQIQRTCRKWFGRPPSALAKRHRAVRAATLMAMDDLPPALEAEVFEAYYDQAHLIRDIRRYTGRTPTRLVPDEPSLGVKALEPGANPNAQLFEKMASPPAGDDD